MNKQIAEFSWNLRVRALIYWLLIGKKKNRKVGNLKYICVGNSKTCTTSLLKAFDILGFKTNGYNHNLITEYLDGNDKIILERAKDYDFIKDWPWRQLYKDLDLMYPNCKFILTVRNPDDWVKSYINNISTQDSEMDEARIKYYGFDPKKYLDDKEYLIKNIYEKKNQDVLEYFNNRKEDLLIIDLSKSGQWKKICDFVKEPIPKVPFPFVNKGFYKKD